MPSHRIAALVFSGLIGLVCAFQLALALGAPWGQFAMGGAFPGVFPPAMRLVAVVQIGILALIALLVMVGEYYARAIKKPPAIRRRL